MHHGKPPGEQRGGRMPGKTMRQWVWDELRRPGAGGVVDGTRKCRPVLTNALGCGYGGVCGRQTYRLAVEWVEKSRRLRGSKRAAEHFGIHSSCEEFGGDVVS